jgi:cell division protein FtsZ
LRQQIAQADVRELRSHVDALFPFVSKDFDLDTQKGRWQSAAARQAPLAFMEVCRNIMNPVCMPGLVNVDFEDLRHIILSQEGECALGFGSANDALGASTAAIEHALLGRDRLEQASSALISINAPQQFLQLPDSWTVLNSVRKQMPSDAQVLFGTTYDENLGKEISVSILANGIRQT